MHKKTSNRIITLVIGYSQQGGNARAPTEALRKNFIHGNANKVELKELRAADERARA